MTAINFLYKLAHGTFKYYPTRNMKQKHPRKKRQEKKLQKADVTFVLPSFHERFLKSHLKLPSGGQNHVMCMK